MRSSVGRHFVQKGGERAPRGERALKRRPVAHRLIDGGERPAQQDRARDHQARRHLAPNHEHGPEPEHHRLEEQAQRFREHAVEAVSVRGRQRPVQNDVAQFGRARHDGVLHAETLHGFAARAHLLDEGGGTGARLPNLHLDARRSRLIEKGDSAEQAARENRQQPEHPVEREEHEQKHRRPRRVEEGERPRTRGEALDRLQIAKTRRRARAFGGRDRAGEDGPEHARIEARLQPRARAGENPPARVIEHAHYQKQKRHDDDQRHQRRAGARTQHPVVDLQHEQRTREHQQVHHHAEETARNQEPAAFRENRPDLFFAASAPRLHSHLKITSRSRPADAASPRKAVTLSRRTPENSDPGRSNSPLRASSAAGRCDQRALHTARGGTPGGADKHREAAASLAGGEDERGAHAPFLGIALLMRQNAPRAHLRLETPGIRPAKSDA